jgi:hypothetical protein
VIPLTSGKHLDELQEVGKAYAKRVSFSHFGAFDPSLALN